MERQLPSSQVEHRPPGAAQRIGLALGRRDDRAQREHQTGDATTGD